MQLVKTYLGFAIKKNSVSIGLDNILLRKRPYKVCLYSSSLSESSKSKLKALNDKFPCFEIENAVFEDVVSSTAIKAIAVFDSSLAGAIISQLN